LTRSANRRKADAIKRELQRRGKTYGDVADRAGYSWFNVWPVIKGRRRSAPVMRALGEVLAERADG